MDCKHRIIIIIIIIITITIITIIIITIIININQSLPVPTKKRHTMEATKTIKHTAPRKKRMSLRSFSWLSSQFPVGNGPLRLGEPPASVGTMEFPKFPPHGPLHLSFSATEFFYPQETPFRSWHKEDVSATQLVHSATQRISMKRLKFISKCWFLQRKKSSCI